MIIVSILAFIVVLGGLVLLHEVGHFVAAKVFKVGVEEFGIGFPPRAKAFVRNGITYSLNWIPIGGFVKIRGVVGGDQDDTVDLVSGGADAGESNGKLFNEVPLWQRFTIIFAGIGMNWLLAAVLFSVGFMIGMPAATDTLPPNAQVEDVRLVVAQIAADVPAAAEGVQAGDQIVSINQSPVTNVTEIRSNVEGLEPGSQIDLQVKRDNSIVDLRVTTTELPSGGTGIGATFVESGIVRLPFFTAISYGVQQTYNLTIAIFQAFGQLIGNIFTDASSVSESVSGPLGIASLTYEATLLGFVYVLQFAALLSINLAIFNFLPLPALDGGRIVFLLFELILRRPVNATTEAIVHNIGFLILLLMIIAVTIKDVFTLF